MRWMIQKIWWKVLLGVQKKLRDELLLGAFVRVRSIFEFRPLKTVKEREHKKISRC